MVGPPACVCVTPVVDVSPPPPPVMESVSVLNVSVPPATDRLPSEVYESGSRAGATPTIQGDAAKAAARMKKRRRIAIVMLLTAGPNVWNNGNATHYTQPRGKTHQRDY